MDNNITFKIQETLAPKDQEDEQDEDDEEEEEEEETLSLCDFPLNSNEPKTDHHRRRSSSQLPDFFEFFNNFSESNMSHAEDIISGGKLVPYRQSPPLSDDRIIKSMPGDEFNPEHLSRRYCDSLPEMMIPTRSNSASAASAAAATKLTRSSRSLDCRKLRRNSSLVMKSEASDIHRNLLSDGSVKSERFKGLSRPSRWYSLMFGPVKFPPEMDLRDMKNRQVRRKVTAVDAGGKSPANRSDRRSSSSWGYDLLSVLSCKNHASVAVKASSVGFVPQL